MTGTLADNLALAWGDRARSHEAIVHQAITSPALFKPEFVEAEARAYQAASTWARYWTLEAMR